METHLNNNLILQMKKNQHRSQNIFLSQSSIIFQSKWSTEEINTNGLHFIEFTAGQEIHSVESETPLHNNFQDSYSDLYFRASSKRRIYNLDPYKILALLSDMGGLLDIITSFGTLLTLSIVRNAFDRSLLSDTYQVQEYAKDSTEFYESRNARVCRDKLKTPGNSMGPADQIRLTSSEETEESDSDELEDRKEEVKKEAEKKEIVEEALPRNLRRNKTFDAKQSVVYQTLPPVRTSMLDSDSARPRKRPFFQSTSVSFKLDKLPIPFPRESPLKKQVTQEVLSRETKEDVKETFADTLLLRADQMEQFIKYGIRRPYISVKPKRQQLYFLYKLILNRTLFRFNFMDRMLHRLSKFTCCLKKRLIEKWCSKHVFKKAEKRAERFRRGKQKLTKDLDIVTLIQRQQMHDVNKQVLYNATERFLLQY